MPVFVCGHIHQRINILPAEFFAQSVFYSIDHFGHQMGTEGEEQENPEEAEGGVF